jgi:hypothetical protein
MVKKKSAKKPAKAPAKPKKPAATIKSSGMVARRADLGAAVGIHFVTLPQPQRGIAEKLHTLITKAAPKATHAVKWGMPVYEHHGMLCYIRSRPRYVTLGFYFSGTRLKDPKGLLTGTGENMRHAKLALDAPIPEKDLTEFVKQAVKMNESGEA